MECLKRLAGIAVALTLGWACVANAQSVAPATVEAITQARDLAQGTEADVDRALRLLDQARSALDEADHVNRYVLAASAASIARIKGRLARAGDLFATAAEAIAQVDGQEDRHASTLEARANTLLEAGRTEAARGAYEEADALRTTSGTARTSAALDGATARLTQAVISNIEPQIVAAMQRLAVALPNNPDLQPRAELSGLIALARGYGHLGLYDGMLAFSESAEQFLLTAGTERKLAAAGNSGGVLACVEEEASRRDLASVLILAAEFDAAERVLTGALFLESCAEIVAGPQGRYLRSMLARLALAAGAPVIAQTRLAEFVRNDNDGDVEGLDRALAEARLAAAETQLGFLGRAERFYASEAAARGFELVDYQVEHLIAWSLHDFLSDRSGAALDRLAIAARTVDEKRPHDWLLRARIDFRRAYLLIDEGHVVQARLVRKAFEDRLESHPGKAEGTAKLAFGTPRADAILASLRGLFDLLVATETSDADAVAEALAAFKTAGAPSLPGLEYFGQRAVLDACVMTSAMRVCSSEMAMNFALPYNVPYRLPTLLSSQQLPNLSGDLFRYGPLRERLYEPLSARLWQAARRAAKEAREAVGNNPDYAILSAAIEGGGTAFEMAQQLIEGGAETTATQVSFRLAAGDSRLGELIRHRDQLSERILRARLTLLDSSNHAVDDDLAELADVQQRIMEDFPDFRARYRSDPISWYDIRQLLRPTEAAMLIHTADAFTDVFLVDNERLYWHRADLGRAEMTQRVRALRAGLDPTGGARSVKALNSVKDRTGFDHTAAHALYRKLFSGLDDAIGDKELQVVVNGPLAALPLSVLVTDLPAQEGESASRRTQWLALRNAVTVLPSLAMLRLRDTAKAPTPGTGFVGFGDPAFAGNASENATTRAGRAAILSELAPLPGTRREIEAIASIFPSEARDIRLGEAATEAAVRGADLTGHGVVAFATHGLLAGDLGADSEPGLAFTRTGSTAEDDGFLTASEAATLKIDADWLLLSACNTAASDGDPDSGGYSGLARAFLFAGARSILVSHWPVRDDAAPALTVSAIKWLRENPSESPARALQQAMVEMIRSPQLPGHADPSAWAPFVLFSGGR
ncbi:CHAT domain-containing protein [Nitratireductor mangrovi]|nr:CHAT domain-containing protein [Nitratireductor mangrovi]